MFTLLGMAGERSLVRVSSQNCSRDILGRNAMASTKKMDAIALLKADHRKVEALFAKFEKAKDAKVKKALAAEI